MKKLIILSIFTISVISTYSQVFEDFCGTDCSLKSAVVCPIDFSDISNEPIKYVNVNMIFIRRNDGTGGFQQNDTEHEKYINDIINNSNNFMSSIPSGYDPICYNGNQGVTSDSKIQFVYNLHYVNNTLAWNNSSTALNNIRDSILLLSTEPAISMLYTESESPFQDIIVNQNCPITHTIPNTSFANLPSSNFDQILYVRMRGIYLKYYWMMNCVVGNSNWGSPSSETVYLWMNPGRIQAHELCHNLNLDDIEKPNGDCDEHLMMHNSGGYGNFLSPLEIQDLHIALTSLSARKYVSSTCYSSTPYSITSSKTWNNNIRIYRGINHTAGTFNLSNEVIIPSETDFITTGTGRLVMNNATIHTPHNNSVLDFKVQSNSTSTISNSTISNCNVEISGSSNVTISETNINLGNSSSFTVALGATLTINQGTIIQ